MCIYKKTIWVFKGTVTRKWIAQYRNEPKYEKILRNPRRDTDKPVPRFLGEIQEVGVKVLIFSSNNYNLLPWKLPKINFWENTSSVYLFLFNVPLNTQGYSCGNRVST